MGQESKAEVRSTGHLSNTHNLDMLRDTLWQMVRTNRASNVVRSVFMLFLNNATELIALFYITTRQIGYDEMDSLSLG